MFFLCDYILEKQTPHSSSSQDSLSLKRLAVFRVRKKIFWSNLVVPSVHVFLRALYSCFCVQSFFLSTVHYDIILTALISEAPRLSNTRLEHDGYRYSPLRLSKIRETRRPSPSPRGLISHPSCGGVSLAFVRVRNRRSCCWQTASSPTHPRSIFFHFHPHAWAQDGPHNALLSIIVMSVSFEWPC